jgi:hypothetical protein
MTTMCRRGSRRNGVRSYLRGPDGPLTTTERGRSVNAALRIRRCLLSSIAVSYVFNSRPSTPSGVSRGIPDVTTRP